MTDSIFRDTLISHDTYPQVSNHLSSSNIWMWIAVILFIICLCELLLIIGLMSHKRERRKDTLRDVVENDGAIDFANIMQSAFQSEQLCKELKIKCHPDRFATDPTKQQIADDLFQRITQNKVNYKVLLELKKEAEQKLNIKFNT